MCKKMTDCSLLKTCYRNCNAKRSHLSVAADRRQRITAIILSILRISAVSCAYDHVEQQGSKVEPICFARTIPAGPKAEQLAEIKVGSINKLTLAMRKRICCRLTKPKHGVQKPYLVKSTAAKYVWCRWVAMSYRIMWRLPRRKHQ